MATTFSENWLSYTIGQIPSDHYKIWDSTSGVNQGATVQANPHWAGTPNSLAMVNSTWGAVLYTGVQFPSTGLTIRYRGDSDRCNLVWNMQSNTLDGVTNVSGYVWQFIPSTNTSNVALNWQGGVSNLINLQTTTYVAPNNRDMNFQMIQNGSSITCSINGTIVHTITDNSFPNSSGYIGWQNFASTSYRGLFNAIPTATPLGKNQGILVSEIQ